MTTKVRLITDLELIIPVPLHSRRLKERGFNQALLLAHQVSETYHIPLSSDNLFRVRRTRPQVELTGEERRKNVEGAFALRRPGDITDRRVVIIDDVFTTGATMNECAAVLKRSGAAQVTALTLARAM